MSTRPLTKLSFRRDVKLFFSVLVGFFIVLIATLLLFLQQVVSETREATWHYRNAVADAAVLQASASDNADAVLTSIAGRPGIVAAELAPRGGRRVTFGPAGGGEGLEHVSRSGAWGSLTLWFDATPLTSIRRKLFFTSAIALMAALASVVLLLLYIPRITGPIEKMLDQATELERRDPGVGEQEYLIETFRKSVATLKAQQEELRVLHDAQKSRADDFERVTAALMRGLTSGLLAIAPDGSVVDVNDAAREMLRIATADDVVGRDVASAIGEGEFAEVLRDALGRRAPLTRVETTHRTADGTTLVIGVTTVPLLSEAGVLLGMLALFTDLTSIRSLEHRVRDLQALADLGEMSAGIAHEFRNSLSAILGYLKLAQREQAPDEVATKLRRAEDEASQLSAAVASLLSFARPMALHPERIDLRELADSVIARLEPAANGVAIHVDGNAVIDGDRALLSRAVENILRNAIESTHTAGRKDGRVDIHIDGARRNITVRDNGVGIDPNDAARMFLPFQSDKPSGFGLGLALTKKIVLLHGGAIRLTGTPGEGAEVEIEW